jgi:hypothetical protein
VFQIQLVRMLPGVALFLLGLASGVGLSGPSSTLKTPLIKTILEDNKVLVSEVIYEKNARRPPHQRQNDQVIVFLNNAQYEVVYPDGKKELRDRKAGDVIWHGRGEIAPNLTNTASQYRTIVVNLK